MRILCVNLNYMGDALFTTPALAALRARFPDARMDVLVGERAAAILEGNPCIDRLIVRPPHGGSGRAVALSRTLRTGAYDIVVLFQSTLTNALLSLLARVPVRIGFAQEGCGPLLTGVVDVRRPGEHDVDAYLRLAAAVPDPAGAGALPPEFAPRLRVALAEKDRQFAADFFVSHELVPPVVGLVIGATRAQKRWPAEYFARLAEKLWNVAGMSSVLLGGPDERETAAQIVALAGPSTPLISAVGLTTEKQLAALIGKLRVVVSGDSGPLHIATAMETPAVALFGSTDPADTGPWTPRGASAASASVLYDALSCAPCRKNPTCEGRYDCMRALTPERVFDAVCDLIGHPARLQRTPLRVLAPEPIAPPRRGEASIGGRPIRSVLVLTKHRFMGDTIVAVPLLRAVRQVFPGARISLLTGSDAAVALQNCPYDINLLPNDPKTKARTYAGSARLSAYLVRRMGWLLLHDRPDLCLVVDRSFRSAVAAWLCGGRVRVGFDTEGRGWLLTHPVPYDMDRRESECCLDILRAIAPEIPPDPPYDPVPDLWLTEAERQRGAGILAEAGITFPCAAPLVGFQPGASAGDRKQWLTERFAAVARAVHLRTGATIVLMGYGDAERATSQLMRAALGADIPVVDLTGKTRLRETMAVQTHLSLFVSNDTGIGHTAAALGVPTVTLFGPTPARKWGNAGPNNAVIAAPDGAMESIDVDTVQSAALLLLGQSHRVGMANSFATGVAVR